MIDPNRLAGGQAPVLFVVRTSGNYGHLSQVMDGFMRHAWQDPGLARPLLDLSLPVPRLDVQIDRALAAKLKLSVSVLGDTLATILGARNVSHFSWLGGFLCVVLELEAATRNNLSALDEVSVRAMGGKRLPLLAFIQAVETTGPDALPHFKQFPTAQLAATLTPGAFLGRVIAALEQAAQEALPPEFAYDFVGLSRQRRQANMQVGLVFLLALMLIYLFLAAQIESFDDPVIVLITVPGEWRR